jgi:membrane fusion protein (multidrug efflux system)
MAEEQKFTRSNSTRSNSAQRGLMKKKRFIIPIVFLLLASILIAAYWYLYLRGYVSTNDAYIAADPVTVSSKILGRITQLRLDEGDATKEGQLLVQLDDSDLRAQEVQAKAALEYTEKNVLLAKVGLDRAKDDFDRASIQFGDKVITREQYDHARQALQMAEAQYKVALSQVNTSKAQLGVVETQLKNTRIFAPVSGVVARKWVMPGDIAQPGQPIFTIYDLNNIWITANFEETKLASIHLDDPVEISVDTYPGSKFTGKVLLIGAAAASQFSLIPPNNASGNFTKVTQRVPVKISIDAGNSGNAEQHSDQISLLPGMSAEVKIRVKSK